MTRVLVITRDDLKPKSADKNILEITSEDFNLVKLYNYFEFEMVIFMDGNSKKLLRNRYGSID